MQSVNKEKDRRQSYKLLLLWAMLAVLGVSASVGVTAAKDEVVIARVYNRPPLSWVQDGQWVGMDVEFYRALEKASGLTFTFVDLPWPRAIHSIKNGSCTIMTQLSKTAEREAFLHYLGPYNSEEMVMMTTRERAAIDVHDLDQLVAAAGKQGLSIGIARDIFYGRAFDERYKSDPAFRAHFEYVGPTSPQMIIRSRLFGVIDQRIAISHRIRTLPDFKTFVIHPFLLNKNPIYFGVTKHVSPDILAKLRAACEKLLRDGTFAAIEAKWKNP